MGVRGTCGAWYACALLVCRGNDLPTARAGCMRRGMVNDARIIECGRAFLSFLFIHVLRLDAYSNVPLPFLPEVPPARGCWAGVDGDTIPLMGEDGLLGTLEAADTAFREIVRRRQAGEDVAGALAQFEARAEEAATQIATRMRDADLPIEAQVRGSARRARVRRRDANIRAAMRNSVRRNRSRGSRVTCATRRRSWIALRVS